MRTLKIGIADYDRMKARTLAIAGGEHTPAQDEPKVWLTSLDRFAKLLSEHNRRLLELIARESPRSLTELAEMAGRSKSNLSRTLKAMSRYGLVELRRGERGTLVPRVPYDHVRLDVSLTGTTSEAVGAVGSITRDAPVVSRALDLSARQALSECVRLPKQGAPRPAAWSGSRPP